MLRNLIRMKIFRDKQCFNTQFAHMSSVLSPDRQASLMPLFWNNNCPSTAPFQSPIQVNSTSIEQNVSIQENLNVTISPSKMIVISNTQTASTWHDFRRRRKLHKLSFQFLFQENCNCLHETTLLKVLIALPAILSGQL